MSTCLACFNLVPASDLVMPSNVIGLLSSHGSVFSVPPTCFPRVSLRRKSGVDSFTRLRYFLPMLALEDHSKKSQQTKTSTWKTAYNTSKASNGDRKR